MFLRYYIAKMRGAKKWGTCTEEMIALNYGCDNTQSVSVRSTEAGEVFTLSALYKFRVTGLSDLSLDD